MTPKDAVSMKAEQKDKKVSERKRNVVLRNILDAADTKRVTPTGEKERPKKNLKKDTAKLPSKSHEPLQILSRRRKDGKAMGLTALFKLGLGLRI